MFKDRIRRMASDNEYLHKDFHMALNNGLDFLEERYGPGAVVEYLRDFADTYHSVLKEDLLKRGLRAIKEYLEEIYAKEKSSIHISMNGDDELTAVVEKCPAVEHIRKNNNEPSKHYIETTRTVYKTICENTPYAFELMEYDKLSGKSKMRFFRR